MRIRHTAIKSKLRITVRNTPNIIRTSMAVADQKSLPVVVPFEEGLVCLLFQTGTSKTPGGGFPS
jgi:hypothetical protein